MLKIYSSFLKVSTFIQASKIRETFAESWLLTLTYHFATYFLWFFIPIFSKKFRMISKKNVSGDGLTKFWKIQRYPSFMPSLQSNTTWFLNFWGGNKITISKWAETLFQSVTAWTTFYLNRGKLFFKNGQIQLFQSGSKVILKWGSYFEVGQNFTSKWGNYFKVRYNNNFMKFWDYSDLA